MLRPVVRQNLANPPAGQASIMALQSALCVDDGELRLYENMLAAKIGSTLLGFL